MKTLILCTHFKIQLIPCLNGHWIIMFKEAENKCHKSSITEHNSKAVPTRLDDIIIGCIVRIFTSM